MDPFLEVPETLQAQSQNIEINLKNKAQVLASKPVQMFCKLTVIWETAETYILTDR